MLTENEIGLKTKMKMKILFIERMYVRYNIIIHNVFFHAGVNAKMERLFCKFIQNLIVPISFYCFGYFLE